MDTAENEQDNIKSNFCKSIARVAGWEQDNKKIIRLRNRVEPEREEFLGIWKEAESHDLTTLKTKNMV